MSDERTVVLPDDLETVYDHFCSQQWSDGLPIVPPTEERVTEALRHTDLSPETELGVLPPRFAPVLVHNVAVCAVMAGCRPEYLPAVIAAVRACLAPQFNIGGVQSTTSATTPVLIFNGPVVERLGINYGVDCLGGSTRANATIGRATRLTLLSVGGATPGVGDKASLGQPAKITCCFAENEQASPWQPLSTDRGFAPGTSTVTAFPATGMVEVRDTDSPTIDGVLTTMAQSMNLSGYLSANNAGEKRPDALVILTPDHARMAAAAGLTKAEVRRILWERARLPYEAFSPEVAEQIRQWRQRRADNPDEVTVTLSPDDISVVVAGGAGTKSMFIPTWGGWAQSATVEVTLP